MKQTFFFILISILGLSLKAQNIDSLYTLWQDQTQPDSMRVQAYEDYILNGYLYSYPDTAAILAKALHAYAKKQHFPKASGTGYNLQGIANYVQGNYSLALEYFQKSLSIQEAVGDKKGIAKNLNNIGLIYVNQGNPPRALESFQKSLAIKEELGDKKGIAAILNNIGLIYHDQGNYPRALEYYQKSLAIKEELGDKKGIAGGLINIGIIYYGQANYPRALEYYEKSLTIFEELGDKVGIATNLGNIGHIHSDRGNFPLALEYYQKSLAIQESLGDKDGMADILSNMGILYNKQGKNASALNYCQRSLRLAEEIGALDLQKEGCKCLYNTYKAMGNDKSALAYYEQMIAMRDSMFNEENTKKLTQLEMQYDFDKKEAATKAEQEKKDALAALELKRQTMARNGFMGGFAVVLLFAGVFFVQRNKIGKEKQRSEELLLNILPEEIARELKEKGKADARDFDLVTTLFTDFVSFTETSEKLSASELVSEINQCFEAFDRITEKYGIEKIKTIGDAYMAAGGLPVPTDDSVKNTVLAALEMQSFIQDRKSKLEAEGKLGFQMRAGIHTGPVVAGIVGVKKFQYDIWGDTVNTASRMENSGAAGKVNISRKTYELLKEDPQFTFEPRGKVNVKGKGEMEMYFLTEV
ncbi:MAG: tetratricopeptide repeat protein [Flavobacteriales bacterium]|nr:tetratricopeptide repeat protein [Flavobacteriales bacterium]